MKAKVSLLTAFVAALCAAFIIFSAGAAALPKKVDPDHDGMPTRWEKRYHLNPLVKDGNRDYDHDGLSNKEEYLHHTDPRKSDTDGDGMPDGWEVEFHLDPTKNDAAADHDHDGYDNLAEYRAGTNPDKASSHPKGTPGGKGEEELEEGEEGANTPSYKKGYAVGCQLGTVNAKETVSTGVDHYAEDEPESANEGWNEGWEAGYEDCYVETLEAAGYEWWEGEEAEEE